MDDNELANRLTEGVGGPELWRLRRNTAYATGRNFEAVGELLEAAADPKDEVYKQIFRGFYAAENGGRANDRIREDAIDGPVLCRGSSITPDR